jgi:pimeloyl-ACP methyl ester carboxylesterase
MNRRQALSLSAASGLTLSGCAGMNTGAGAAPAVVLVHGAWHGGWCWDAVAALLRGAGHAVFTPTLPGMAEDGPNATPATDLASHVQAVVGLIDREKLQDFVLVGHSYGGFVISGAADQRADHIRHLVYLDAFVPRDGDSVKGYVLPERWQALEDGATQVGRGFLIPSPPPEYFGVPNALAASVAARLTGQPIATFTQPAQLPRGGALAVKRRTYIACDLPAIPQVASVKQRLRTDPAWRYESMATGHDAMITQPQELSQLLMAAAKVV